MDFESIASTNFATPAKIASPQSPIDTIEAAGAKHTPAV
jgi:hypothetical protein